MYVSHLQLHDFRSYADVDVELGPGPTAFIGRNGQGKTNLVEAVDYLSRLSSHRVATDAPLVRAGTEQALVRAAVVRDGRTAVLEVEITPGRSNRARVNKAPLPRPASCVGLVRTVVFSPEDLTLVQGRPVRPPPLPRRPAGPAEPAPGRRALGLRPGAAPAQLPAQDGRRRGPRRLARDRAVDPRGVGLPPGPDRRGAARRPALPGRRLRPYLGAAYEAVAGGATREAAGIDYKASFEPPESPRCPTSRRVCSPSSPAAATTSSTAGSRWSARTATSWCAP